MNAYSLVAEGPGKAKTAPSQKKEPLQEAQVGSRKSLFDLLTPVMTENRRARNLNRLNKRKPRA